MDPNNLNVDLNIQVIIQQIQMLIKQIALFKNQDFGGFRPSNHDGWIGLAESYSKMGINFSGDE